ncbi:Chemotaxis response regulator protein-glutamate methylesterase [Pseudomonas syringae pv. cilantro]|uniref:Protein-glutamate methylesterase/protein-glutamine glutaminase n=2 Tax=Pseudomonas syringae group TaxID=136849 RepID=A0A0N0XDL1_PSESX|nr:MULTISPECIES: chemotaxis response regulator protein-glutamate methylesterase [Pseudomonas syringae group]KPC34241.1 Chemotaxis response regulator protein-glutamate methylesterase [Pseudomonas syringae pv. cilantro]KPW72047.1 Chemotaxis response regulator protein-glutamate methylesterase [Pseudomonas syringae pv. coriandricola]RMN14249.1 Chemotaxis response regulator protein-glutamate methylesterase [Pseudomonas syringae pv. coriandricola]
MPNKKISVLLVDDSAVVRQVLVAILNDTPDMHVMGAASDPIFAMSKLAQEWPDVIVLDIEMPRMDGITFLKKIMSERPTPVVICSSLTQKGAETSLQALSAGAVEIITKPTTGLKNFLIESAAELVSAIRAAANSNVKNLGKRTAAPVLNPASKLTADAILPAASGHAMAHTTERIVAIGTSTGGTQALEAVLTALPRVCPGMVIVQHMPEKFTASFAERLNSLSQIEVREAKNNDRILPGLALIAPGGKHMMVTRSGAYYHVQVIDGPLVNRHRPSVDVLFRSVAKFAGKNATGIIMTGMGDDGARGLKEMLDAGGSTVAQDEASCVVFGMPKEAIKLNAAQRIIPLQEIHQVILHR